jgi:hypothetical protein
MKVSPKTLGMNAFTCDTTSEAFFKDRAGPYRSFLTIKYAGSEDARDKNLFQPDGAFSHSTFVVYYV